MKRLVQATPLKTGNTIVFMILSLAIGFAVGWVVHYYTLQKFSCFPVL